MRRPHNAGAEVLLREDLKAVLARLRRGLEPVVSNPRTFTYARQAGSPFLQCFSTPDDLLAPSSVQA